MLSRAWHSCKCRPRQLELCREMGLFTAASVAIDGSKFKAVNNRDKNFTKAKVQRRQAQPSMEIHCSTAAFMIACATTKIENLEAEDGRIQISVLANLDRI